MREIAMYFYFCALLLLCLLLYLILHFRKTGIIKKIGCMSECEKLELLNRIITPAGFRYDPEEDIFTSTLDAWQRDFGYTALYDEAAPLAQLVFDCLPVYFDYQDKTWLLELWKGQYGINTGAELGIYHADSIVSPEYYQRTRFHAVSDEELLSMRLTLTKNKKSLFQIAGFHWWLTGFCMGTFSQPEELGLQAQVTFPSAGMTNAFLDAWETQRCRPQEPLPEGRPCSRTASNRHFHELNVCGETVTISLGTFCECGRERMFRCPIPTPCTHRRFRCAFSQWKNRLFVRIYRHVTRPFRTTPDRLLCLWYFLPFAFRRMIQPRKKKCYRI